MQILHAGYDTHTCKDHRVLETLRLPCYMHIYRFSTFCLMTDGGGGGGGGGGDDDDDDDD